jgi:protein-tyrosine-phosphatase
MTHSSQITDTPDFLNLIGHKVRWQLLQTLALTDMHVQELVDTVKQPQNLVSYHLRKLSQHGILREHRSIADGREIYYSLDLERLRVSYFSIAGSLHPALDIDLDVKTQVKDFDPKAITRVLFLCTHNSARSQIAEAILRSRSDNRIEVHSAGSEPTEIHPFAIRALAEMSIDISGQSSKDIQQFLGQQFDYIITVCDRAKESCPVFPGDPIRIHWSFPDPADAEGTEEQRFKAFKETTIQLMTRVSYLLLMIKRQHT